VPDLALDHELFVRALVTMTVLLDPVGNAPVFLALSRSLDPRRRRQAAWQAAVVAGVVILVFAFFGDVILQSLGIGLPALQAAGGLLLAVVALELLRPFDERPHFAGSATGNIALVPLGTPLLAGPGAMATVMVYMRQSHGAGARVSVLLALVASLVVVYLSLRFAGLFARLLKPDGVQVVSQVMGFLLAAIAVQLVAGAVEQWTGVRLG
jgi:MarC family membrane protein